MNANLSNGAATGQLMIVGASNPNQELWLGYDTTSDYGVVQAIKQGVSAKPLVLQPSGGNVGINGMVPPS